MMNTGIIDIFIMFVKRKVCSVEYCQSDLKINNWLQKIIDRNMNFISGNIYCNYQMVLMIFSYCLNITSNTKTRHF